MPKYNITSPDGRKFVITGDRPPTQEEAASLVSSIKQKETIKLPEPQTGKSVGEFLLNKVPQSIGSLVSGTVESVSHPMESLKSLRSLARGEFSKLVGGKPEEQKTAEAFNKAMIERYGSMDKFKETLYNDPAGTLLDISTVLYPAGGGLKAAGKASKIAALERIGEAATKGAELTNIQGVALNLPKAAIGLILPETKMALIKAIKPSNRNRNFNRDLESAIPDIVDTAKKYNMKIDGIDDMNAVATRAKYDLAKEYYSAINKAEKSGIDVSVNGEKIADRMMETVTPAMEQLSPGISDKVAKLADSFRKNYDIALADDIRVQLNREASALYGKGTDASQNALNNAIKKAYANAADEIRMQIDQKLAKAQKEVPNTAELRKRWGALINVEEEAAKRAVVAGRSSPVGLSEQLNYPVALGKIVTGGNPVEGLLTMLATYQMKQLGSTDSIIKNAFQRMGVSGPTHKGAEALRIGGTIGGGQIGRIQE